MHRLIGLPAAFARWCAVLCLTATTVLFPTWAQAQLSAADEQAVRSHVLKDDTVKRVLAVAEEGRRAKINTAGDAPPESLDAWAKQIEAQPQAKALLAKHRLSGREYLINIVAMMRAGMAVELKTKDLQAVGTNAANVAYVTKNRPNIQGALLAGDDE